MTILNSEFKDKRYESIKEVKINEKSKNLIIESISVNSSYTSMIEVALH